MAFDKNEFWPKVLQVVPTDNFEAYAYFNDGSVHMVDIKPFMKPGTVFVPLSDIAFFKERLAIINDTVAWDITGDKDSASCVDLDPFSIFESPAVADPLK